MNGIEALDLVKDFGPFRAVDRVSFHVRGGTVQQLAGELTSLGVKEFKSP